MSTIIIHIAGMYTGFLTGVGEALSANHDVTIVVSSDAGKRSLLAENPELSIPVVSRPTTPLRGMSDAEIIDESLKRERFFGETFAMVAAYDRGLGKGYIFNADRHPDVPRSKMSHSDKLKAVLGEFEHWESLFAEFEPDIVISKVSGKVSSLVARKHGAHAFGLVGGKFGNHYMWTDNEHLASSLLEEAIQRHLQNQDAPPGEQPSLPENNALMRHRRISYRYRDAVRLASFRVFRETKQKLRAQLSRFVKRRKGPSTTGYRFLAWIPSVLRRPVAYSFFRKFGKSLAELAGTRFVYVPLHLEPEAALLWASPEFNNSMEMIAWISKSLPADTVVVVKEQPYSYGIRSLHYYEMLLKMPNVVLAQPDEASQGWIEQSSFVATLTGTAGFESIYKRRPVLSFGKHQAINLLPTVRYCHDLESTQQAVAELGALQDSDVLFDKARWALYQAQMDTTFEMPPTFEVDEFKIASQPQSAEIAVANLTRLYPEVFGT